MFRDMIDLYYPKYPKSKKRLRNLEVHVTVSGIDVDSVYIRNMIFFF